MFFFKRNIYDDYFHLMNYILWRIKELADQEGISITALEAAIGASKGVFSRALANGTYIQSKWLVKLIENYPRYSSEWLLTGNGEIKKSDSVKSAAGNDQSGDQPDLTNELIQSAQASDFNARDCHTCSRSDHSYAGTTHQVVGEGKIISHFLPAIGLSIAMLPLLLIKRYKLKQSWTSLKNY